MEKIIISLFFVLIIFSSSAFAERTIKVNTKDNEVSNIKQVEVILEEPKTYMDTSVHTLNSIDLKINNLLEALNRVAQTGIETDAFKRIAESMATKLQWWEDLKVEVLAEVEKVQLITTTTIETTTEETTTTVPE